MNTQEFSEKNTPSQEDILVVESSEKNSPPQDGSQEVGLSEESNHPQDGSQIAHSSKENNSSQNGSQVVEFPEKSNPPQDGNQVPQSSEEDNSLQDSSQVEGLSEKSDPPQVGSQVADDYSSEDSDDSEKKIPIRNYHQVILPTNKLFPEDKKLVRKIRAIPLRFPNLPDYLQSMMRVREAAKAEYISTNEEEKKIKYYKIFEAVESELRLHQYTTYRRNTDPDLLPTLAEWKLQTHLSDYINKLIKENISNRLIYKTTNDALYKIKYNATKNVIKILLDALEDRRGFDIVIGLDNKTLKIVAVYDD